jgi:O-glycosyl hydrolase
LAAHIYGTAFTYGSSTLSEMAGMKALSQQYGIPLWMTEYWVWDMLDWANVMHDCIAGYDVTAVDYLWGFFGRWEPSNDALIWGLNNGAQYLGYTINKNYYVMGQYSKYVMQGVRRVQANSSSASVNVTAYIDGTKLTVVAINNGGAVNVNFALSGVSGIASMQPVRTSQRRGGDHFPYGQRLRRAGVGGDAGAGCAVSAARTKAALNLLG